MSIIMPMYVLACFSLYNCAFHLILRGHLCSLTSFFYCQTHAMNMEMCVVSNVFQNVWMTFQTEDISDDSSPGQSADNSPVMTPQSTWRDCLIQLPGTSSVEVTPTHRAAMRGAAQRDPSPTPYYRKLAAAIHMADQELKGHPSNKRVSLTPEDAYFADQSQTNTPELSENQKKNYFFKAIPKVTEKNVKPEKDGNISTSF